MQTDWNKLSAISQIVGTIAIVVTLIFLTLQTNQQTQAINASARQGALEIEMELIQEMQRNPDIWYADFPVVPGYDEELSKLIMIANLGMMRSRENLWLQYRDGTLDEETWLSYRGVLISNIQDQEPARFYWEFFSPGFNPAFVAEINTLARETGVSE